MTYVIAGGGLAGAKAAETLRSEGFSGRIMVIGDEAELPYERPPLSKGLLLGTSERDSVYVHGRDWYQTNNIDLMLGTRLTGIDRPGKLVTLSDGSQVGYEKLLLATGSRPRELALPGVHYLRTLADRDTINANLGEGKHVVIIGAGWIGLEVAAAAVTRGAKVTVLEMAQLPLQRVLGDDIGSVFATLHQRHGVVFHFATTASPELVASLHPDLVVAGAGIQPNTEAAEAAGLTVDNGIVTDQSLRTSDPHIYAAGDVASSWHPLLHRNIRVEHWANALNTGPAAARAMLGQDVSYELLPYFYTDQYDLSMEYSGYAAPGDYDRVVIRGSLETLEFLAFWTYQGRVLAGMNVNVWDVQDDIQALIRAGYAGQSINLSNLADPDVALSALLT